MEKSPAPLGRGVGCRVWGVGEEAAPTTIGSEAPPFLRRLHWARLEASSNAVSSTPNTLPPTPFFSHIQYKYVGKSELR